MESCFQIHFWIIGRNLKIFKQMVRCDRVNTYFKVLYINGFSLTSSSYKLMESIFPISNLFSNNWLKNKKYSIGKLGVNIDYIAVLYINGNVSTSSTNWRNVFFQISNSILKYWPKTEKYPNKWWGVNIDQSSKCYISMVSARPALQTNGKHFSNFEIIFELTAIFKNNNGIGVLMHVCRGGICAGMHSSLHFVEKYFLTSCLFLDQY